MIRSGRSSLVVTSTGTEPETVTKLLEIEPTEVNQKGAGASVGSCS